MANSKILTKGDKLAEDYQKALIGVLKDLDKRVVDIVSGAVTARSQYDAGVILNSRAQLIQALRDSGYNALNEAYIAEYEGIPALVKEAMQGKGLPPVKFTAIAAALFAGLASADLQAFEIIGVNAMDELRLGLYKQAVSGQPFSALVENIAAATVGVDGKGSPLRNYAYTYANTAVLSFGGQALRISGETLFNQLGVPESDQFWEVIGPLDSVTREECREALANPIRTKAEWQQHTNANGLPYWNLPPGGWNCRHQLIAVVT